MTTVSEIKRAIDALSPKELDELYTWMDQNYPTDAPLNSDLDAGRYDDRIARVRLRGPVPELPILYLGG